MRPYTKAILIGAAIALLVVFAVVGLVATGTLESFVPPAATDSVLLILVARDADGTESAAFAYAVNTEDGRIEPVDTSVRKTIPGTSAETPAEAYPFGGGAIVAAAVADQTGGDALPWVVLPEAAWTSMVDDDGKVAVDVPSQISVFLGEDLTLLDPGAQELDGAEAAALVAGLEYVDDADRADLKSALEAELSRVVISEPARLSDLVARGQASTSLGDTELEALGWAAP